MVVMLLVSSKAVWAIDLIQVGDIFERSISSHIDALGLEIKHQPRSVFHVCLIADDPSSLFVRYPL